MKLKDLKFGFFIIDPARKKRKYNGEKVNYLFFRDRDKKTWLITDLILCGNNLEEAKVSKKEIGEAPVSFDENPFNQETEIIKLCIPY